MVPLHADADHSTLNILHISDVQFGRNHRFGRLGLPPPDDQFDSLLTRLTDDLDVLRDDPNLNLRPDIVVVSGDVTEWARKKEFDDVFEFLAGVQKAVGLPRSRLLIVPGNHDINRKLCEAHFNECAANDEAPLQPYWVKWKFWEAFFHRFYEDVPSYKFVEAEPWTFFELAELHTVVAGLNSTMRESHEGDHFGWLGEPQLRWFREKLARYRDDGWFRLGLVHHNALRGAAKDDANLKDADQLQALLGDRLNLLLHGHTHTHKVSWLTQHLPVLSAGSASVTDEERPEGVPNQYQFVRISPGELWYGGRAFAADQRRWIGDTRVGVDGSTWYRAEDVRFEHIHAALPLPAATALPQSGEPGQHDCRSEPERIEEMLASLSKMLIWTLEHVARQAERDLASIDPRFDVTQILARIPNVMSTVTAEQARNNVTEIRRENLDAIRRLCMEPFVARVVAQNSQGKAKVFYFARSVLRQAVSSLDGTLASYRSPHGCLAEAEVGEEVEVHAPKRHETYKVLEKVRLRPERIDDGFDGLHDRIERDDVDITIRSLRQFLQDLADAVEAAAAKDIIGKLTAEVLALESVRQGFRRQIIARMSLRDQPTLDKFQGEVFRLALNERLMLSGPPGTGKTTTLIRRLAQKRNFEELDEYEQELVGSKLPVRRIPEFFHPNNWVMYSPTELLKLYLKEAFAQEGVAASDERVRVWSDERRRLARDVFGILRSGHRGHFTLDETISTLRSVASADLSRLADAFRQHTQRASLERFQAALKAVEASRDHGLRDVAAKLRTRLPGNPTIGWLFRTQECSAELAGRLRDLTQSSRDTLRGIMNDMLGNNTELLTQLAVYIGTIDIADLDDEAEAAVDQEISIPRSRNQAVSAADALQRAVIAAAIARYTGTTLQKSSRHRKVMEWFGGRAPAESGLFDLGEKTLLQRHVRDLVNVKQRLIDDVPIHYQGFRAQMLHAGEFYRPDLSNLVARWRVNGHEVDIVLLTVLELARKVLDQDRDLLWKETGIASIESLKGEFVTQVLVDEATDFSAVQLRCMLALSHPLFRSLFACGDVNQRVTSWGLQSLQELKWVDEGFDIREVTIGYRQSRGLAELAKALLALRGTHQVLHLPEYGSDADPHVPPTLGETLDGERLAAWLCARIREVEIGLNSLPSIAIFVDGDESIEPLVRLLKPLLTDHNLEIVGCPEGRIVGHANEIRVFDVRHIKGLEFEAVFFVGLDRLAQRLPDQFDKYLYVGLTRAATYLGMTCQEQLPANLDCLRSHFVARWD